MTRFAPGTDLSGIDTLTGLPKGQSRRRSPRRGTVKGPRPRPPMPSPRPPMRGPRPPMRGPMPPRRSDGLSSDKERHALLIGGRRPPMRGGRPPMGGRPRPPMFGGGRPRPPMRGGGRPQKPERTPGYGGRIGAPPGSIFTMDFKDRDGDGVDDRHQLGPGR